MKLIGYIDGKPVYEDPEASPNKIYLLNKFLTQPIPKDAKFLADDSDTKGMTLKEMRQAIKDQSGVPEQFKGEK